MIEEILDTKIKMRITRLLSENEPMTVSDVSRRLHISKSRASVCLRDLYDKGILIRKPIGRSTLYSISNNKLAESVVRSLGETHDLLLQIEKELVKRLEPFSPLSVVIFGSSLRGLKPGKDVDTLLVHKEEIDESKIIEIVADLTQEFGIHISIITMELNILIKKARKGEEFILNIIATHKKIHGKDLEELVWSEK